MSNGVYCFFGIDGAGKSTLIREVLDRLEDEDVDCRKVYMGRSKGHKLPFVGLWMDLKEKLLARKKGVDSDEIDKPIVDIYRERGWIWLSVYFADMWLRYIESIIYARREIILMDRYFYHGLLLSSGRKKRFFQLLIPEPSDSFLIYAPSEVILERKNEASREEIENFYRESEKLSDSFNITKIDNSRELEVVVDEIIQEIRS